MSGARRLALASRRGVLPHHPGPNTSGAAVVGGALQLLTRQRHVLWANCSLADGTQTTELLCPAGKRCSCWLRASQVRVSVTPASIE